MTSNNNYRPIGDFITRVSVKNKESLYSRLLGIKIDKYFMPSVANVIGTDLSKYKIVKPMQFSCNRMHVGRDYRLPIALSEEVEPFIVSPAYDVFEIDDTSTLLPQYLMMWFRREEFDRQTWFYTDTDVRGKLGWDSFCEMQLPVPSIDRQKEIVEEYNIITNRIKLNEQINQNLEATAQAIYKHWFVDFEFPDENGNPYKSSGGKMVYNEELDQEIPEGWEVGSLNELFVLQRGFDLPLRNRILGEYPVYASTGQALSHEEYKVKSPGVVTGRSGSIGSVFYVNQNFWPLNTTLWVKKFRRANPEFSYFYLKNLDIKSYAGGSAVPTLNRNHIHKHLSVIPPLQTQNLFSQLFLRTLKSIKIKTRYNLKLKAASSLLLSKMASN